MRRRKFIMLAGGAAGWPLAARAQQPMPTIGLLTPSKLPEWAVSGIRKGLVETGYVEGRNLAVLHRSATANSPSTESVYSAIWRHAE